ncbi:MAG: iron-containing alcohol dehydrogenase [Spirochaetia bacterium]|jgi:alcohol dehydrogenase class IV|nr:iron-containing alcohol dehydrogenase [Spirochaetia bacterium]
MDKFTISPVPELIFGRGTIKELPPIIAKMGFLNIAVITGGKSFVNSIYWQFLSDSFSANGLKVYHFISIGETTPETVDGIVQNLLERNIDVVLAIGGGTVMDTGKAVSAMLCMSGSIIDYLEGVGTKEPTGKRKPLICVPTTSGTGSEATKNAVITKIGNNGFKKSLRHKAYIPDTVIIDPDLIMSCPIPLTIASGMDAVTQLLESYVSIKSNPFTDQLALNGLKLAGSSLSRLVNNPEDMDARVKMAYAAYLSGITLANAGLGVVHGAASVLGSMRSIPHGVVCGTLLGSATEMIIAKLNKHKNPLNDASLIKYSEAGIALTGSNNLIETLNNWVNDYKVSRLSEYGFTEMELVSASKLTGLKNTPFQLDKKDIFSILFSRL